MLVLTRRVGEMICIGDNIQVRVLAVKGGQVSIGVGAPKDVPVHREEVAERIAAQTGGELVVGQRQHHAAG